MVGWRQCTGQSMGKGMELSCPSKLASLDTSCFSFKPLLWEPGLLATSANSFKQLKFLQTKCNSRESLSEAKSVRNYTLKEDETLNIC